MLLEKGPEALSDTALLVKNRQAGKSRLNRLMRSNI